MRSERSKRNRSKFGSKPKVYSRQIGVAGLAPQSMIEPVSLNGPDLFGEAPLLALESGLPIVVEKGQEKPANPTERFSEEAVRELPSWSISLAVHLCLFLLMAIWSLGDRLNDDTIVLEVSPAGNDIETREADVEMGGGSEAEEEDASASTVPVDPDDTLDNKVQTEVEDRNSDGASQNDGSPNSGNSAGDGDGAGTEFFGASASGSRFVFIVDCSGSMMTDDRWGRAVGQLVSAIEGLSEEQEFLVFLYHSDTVAMLNMKINEAGLIQATEENKAKFNGWLEMQSPVGRTRPAGSMRRALEIIPDAIFFLSDGEFKDDTLAVIQDCNVPHTGADGKRRKTSIHTFFLGTDADRGTMEQIAEQNNGIFTWVK